MALIFDHHTLERLYRRYNRREYVAPDPLQFLYDYPEIRDREIVGLLASSLAYGRVAQILRSVKTLLDRMGPSPYMFVTQVAEREQAGMLRNFRHRFTAGEEVVALLQAARRMIESHGSLGACFQAGLADGDESAAPALTAFVDAMNGACGLNRSYLLPSPRDGSACKRLNLFLRWMMRKDAVDPGGWERPGGAAKLIMPLDTHIHRIGLVFGLTRRRQANMKTALEITRALKNIAPEDPVRYDFALSRFGIRAELKIENLFAQAAGERELS
ncbi:MAG: TIGR02757 family protein [Candidatus Sumerlaeota bacterium]|nr:TIGR02757 family protein [Candidatus Sumerlaeota bacterium]